MFLKCDFSKEQRSSLRMILRSKHFKYFNVKFYVSALVGVIIKVIHSYLQHVWYNTLGSQNNVDNRRLDYVLDDEGIEVRFPAVCR